MTKSLTVAAALLAVTGFSIVKMGTSPKENTASVATSSQTQTDVDLEIPELASRKIMYTSGLPNGRFRAIAVDDG